MLSAHLLIIMVRLFALFEELELQRAHSYNTTYYLLFTPSFLFFSLPNPKIPLLPTTIVGTWTPPPPPRPTQPIIIYRDHPYGYNNDPCCSVWFLCFITFLFLFFFLALIITEYEYDDDYYTRRRLMTVINTGIFQNNFSLLVRSVLQKAMR